MHVGRKSLLSKSKPIHGVNLFAEHLLAFFKIDTWVKIKKTKSSTAANTNGTIKRTTITFLTVLIHSVRESVGIAAGRS